MARVNVPELRQRLKSVQTELQEELNSTKSPRCFGLEDTLTVHQVEDIRAALQESGRCLASACLLQRCSRGFIAAR